jgi:prevent-host-death family protein
MPAPIESRKESAQEIGAEEAKRNLGELLSRVGFGGERIPITRHGKRIAALVSAEDLALLDAASKSPDANQEAAPLAHAP